MISRCLGAVLDDMLASYIAVARFLALPRGLKSKMGTAHTLTKHPKDTPV